MGDGQIRNSHPDTNKRQKSIAPAFVLKKAKG